MDNEEKSAELSSNILRNAHVREDFVNKVYNLILATKHGGTYEDYDTQLLVDIDLSVIGKEAFSDTRSYIREEYSHVSEEEFRTKRRTFFQGLLCRPNLYATETFREKYEEKAKENMKKEVTQLS